MKKKNLVLDRYYIATNQTYELDAARTKLKKEGIEVSRDDIKDAARALKTKLRRKIYAFFREAHKLANS